jgi:hypothetical protein
MRVEWAKSKARADRWSEEVILVREEMRRVIQYFDWKANWWVSQADCRTEASLGLKQGLHAYAYKQAIMYRRMAVAYALRWHPIFIRKGIVVDWLPQYIPATTPMDLD